jgi:hypothetical protein
MINNPNALAAGSTSSLNDILKLTNPPVTGTGGVRGVFGSILGGLGNLVMPGLGSVIGGAIGGAGLGAAMPTLGSDTTQYLMLQKQMEQESLAFETASTVMKVRHDAALHAVENMK